MPYSSPEDLHSNLQKILPEHAQEIYVAAFNSALEQYGTEDAARKVAWTAVKHKYKKATTKVKVKPSGMGSAAKSIPRKKA